jgi:hypothetical protein
MIGHSEHIINALAETEIHISANSNSVVRELYYYLARRRKVGTQQETRWRYSV